PLVAAGARVRRLVPTPGPAGALRPRTLRPGPRGGRHRGLPPHVGNLAPRRPPYPALAAQPGRRAAQRPAGRATPRAAGAAAPLPARQRVVELAVSRRPAPRVAPTPDLAAAPGVKEPRPATLPRRAARRAWRRCPARA